MYHLPSFPVERSIYYLIHLSYWVSECTLIYILETIPFWLIAQLERIDAHNNTFCIFCMESYPVTRFTELLLSRSGVDSAIQFGTIWIRFSFQCKEGIQEQFSIFAFGQARRIPFKLMWEEGDFRRAGETPGDCKGWILLGFLVRS